MKIRLPNVENEVVVTPRFFLGGFDVYDREETLGARLNQFDPNDVTQLRAAFEEFFFNRPFEPELKAALAQVLAEALKADFDFSAVLRDDDEECFYLPDAWTVRNPRGFFEEVHRMVMERWGAESLSIDKGGMR